MKKSALVALTVFLMAFAAGLGYTMFRYNPVIIETTSVVVSVTPMTPVQALGWIVGCLAMVIALAVLVGGIFYVTLREFD